MILYPFMWSVRRPPIPVFDGDKWCIDGGEILSKLGYELPDITAYRAFNAITSGGVIEGGLPNNGEPFAKLWALIIKPTFSLRYADRVPTYQDADDFARHLEAHFNANVYVWVMKWCNAYYKALTLSQEKAESETIAHNKSSSKNGTSKTGSTAQMSANGTKTTAETNSPQVLANLSTPQTYIDNYVKGTDVADSMAENNAESENTQTETSEYTHTRTLASSLGRLPIELQELYVNKMNNLCEEILSSYEIYFVGDMLYV